MPGSSCGLGEQLAVALADAHALQREQRFVQQPVQLGQDGGDLLAGADRDHHRRHGGVAGEEFGACPAPAASAVDAQKHGRAGDTAPVKQVGDGRKRGRPQRALLAAEVDGQLGRLAQPLGQHDLADPAAEQSGALQRDEALALDLEHARERRLDPRARVDRDRDDGQVFGERQQPVGVQVVQPPEAFGAAQQDAGLQPLGAVDVEQRVAEQPAVGAVALAEIGGELQAVLAGAARRGAHACAPIACPSTARAKPAVRLSRMLASARASAPSSVSRCVSSIHVEKVVNEPIDAVPAIV